MSMPPPFADGINMQLNHFNWYCAYKSLEELERYLNCEDMCFLIKTIKFNVFLLEVTNYQIGGNQVAYTKGSVKLKKNINSWFKQKRELNETSVLPYECF